MAPERCGGVGIEVRVLDHFLVVEVLREAPDVLLVETVIDGDRVWVWRMRVEGLTLKVIVLPFLVIVLQWNSSSRADNILILCLEFLNSFKVLRLVQCNVVHVAQEAWIFLITLMPSNEWIIVV